MNNTSSLLNGEFIGLKAKVVNNTNPCSIGICGLVQNETQKSFVLLHKGKTKILIKKESDFQFMFPNETSVRIIGKALIGRPEDRVKNTFKRNW